MIHPILLITLAIVSAVGSANTIAETEIERCESKTRMSRKEIKEEIAEDPGKSGGIYYAYPFTTDSVPEVQEGYEPVLVSHYGRHGSRWAINEKQYAAVTDVLEREGRRGNLTDSGLNGSMEPVQLRFGHDTALIRLLALMKIDGCSKAETNPGKYCEAWQDFRVSPMGANLQLIFYRNAIHPEEDPLVLILHNERPATVPLISATAPFYSWQDLKSLWQ